MKVHCVFVMKERDWKCV